jgi:hypothetical protein
MSQPRTLAGSRRTEQRLLHLTPCFNVLADAIEEIDACWLAMDALIHLIQPQHIAHPDDLSHVDRGSLAALLKALNNHLACAIEDIRDAREESTRQGETA